ncbi:Histidine kinase [Sulfidibacter corallicola]|uniref:Histidine kinase n=1 Tax=Sulfidibacter corallicola TaxID=2818388 RepID=A0A8A4TPK6_SULCO|nr:histidine kinase [Sulfidibacter corallicola]QTD51367.1 histidine kinase [Sulfidibacter corallicola]
MHYFLSNRNLLRVWIVLAISFVAVEFSVNALNIYFFGKPANWYNALVQPLTYFLWILFAPAVFSAYRRVPFEGNHLAFFAKHFAMGLCLCLLHRALVELGLVSALTYVDPEMGHRLNPVNNPDLFTVRVVTGGMSSLFLYVITLAVVVLLWFEGRLRDEAVRRAEAEKGKAIADLRALKMQMQPHFLFNAFNGLASLMEEDVAEAQDYLGRLGEMFHYTLDHQKKDMATVAEELAFAENYLAIQSMRFGDRIAFDLDIEKGISTEKLPTLLFQPLIENAVKHGVAVSTGRCEIEIQAKRDGNRMALRVTNRCQEDIPDKNVEGHGIGLANLEERLDVLYGGDFEMTTQRIHRGFVVQIVLPVSIDE